MGANPLAFESVMTIKVIVLLNFIFCGVLVVVDAIIQMSSGVKVQI